MGGFRGPEVQQKINPNQSIFSSARNAAIFGISVFVIGGLSGGLFFGLRGGPFFGLIFGLIGGGNACIRHFKLRLTLYSNKLAPWNYAHFLDYATERLFLQKVGGGYIFVHRMLLEHFAEMPLEQKRR
jgi:predicted lipid-binding transport protein (Tim44 family)